MYVALWILGCAGEPTPVEPVEVAEPESVEAAPATPAAPGELVLSLNGTEKWQMDDHTRQVMKETEASLDGVVPKTLAEANALGDTLDDQLSRLVDGCTMKGPAHDELHVFLMAWSPEVTALQGDRALVGARARVLRLQQMLHTYGEHFE